MQIKVKITHIEKRITETQAHRIAFAQGAS